MVPNSPVMLSVRLGADPAAASRALTGVGVAPRVRIIGGDAVTEAWLQVFEGRRVSIDLEPDGDPLGAVLGHPVIRQLRFTMTDLRPESVGRVAEGARARGFAGPIVLMVPGTVLADDPTVWALALADLDRVHLNIVRPVEPLTVEDAIERLRIWSSELGDRFFHSLPPIGAVALDAGSACPTSHGMHAFLDFASARGGTCDCRATTFRLGDRAEWVGEWRSEVELDLRASADLCRACPAFGLCRTGCSPKRSARDELCPWPTSHRPAVDGSTR